MLFGDYPAFCPSCACSLRCLQDRLGLRFVPTCPDCQSCGITCKGIRAGLASCLQCNALWVLACPRYPNPRLATTTQIYFADDRSPGDSALQVRDPLPQCPDCAPEVLVSAKTRGWLRYQGERPTSVVRW
jgi:hypothetical protein